MKKVFISAGVLVVIIAVAVVAFVMNLDHIVKTVIVEKGSEVLGSSVELDSIELDISAGAATLNEFSIDTPSNYKPEKLLRIGKLHAEINPDTLVIEKLIADSPRVYLEKKGDKTNFDAMLENVDKALAEYDTTDASEASESGEDLYEINLLQLTNIEAVVDTEFTENPIAVKLPEIKAVNLKGTPEQIAGQIVRQLADAIIPLAAAEELKAQAEAKAKEKLDEVKKEELDKAEGKLNEKLEEEGLGGLKSLFKKDDN